MRLAPIILVTFVSACSDDGGSSAPDAASPGADAGAGDYRADLAGRIELVEDPAGSTTALADLRSGPPVPVAEAVLREGACALYEHPDPALCDPACEPTSACVAAGECVPFTSPAPAGRIEVTGTVTPFALLDGEFGYVADPWPTGDLFTDDAMIAVEAEGDVTPAFRLEARGVAPLAGVTTEFVLEDGVDEIVSWTPAASGSIQLALVTGWHGAPYEAMILCEAPDEAGSLVIPASIIEAFPPHGGIGLLPHASFMTRFRRSVVDVPAGSVELLVGSRVPVSFSH